jgi:hypothetical protein
VNGQSTRREDFYRTVVHEIGHVLGLVDGQFHASAAINSMIKPLYKDSSLSSQQLLKDPTGIASGGQDQLYRFKSPNPLFGVEATFIFGSHLYEGDLYGTNMDPAVAYIDVNGVAQQVTFVTHPNDLMNRRQASPAGNLDPNDPTPRETSRQFISDLAVKTLADAYGYSVVLPSTLNTTHAMLDVWTGTLLVQGGARDNTTGAGVNDTINLVRATDAQGDDIEVTVSYGGNTYTERVPFAQVTNIIIHSNGGTNDVITVNSNVSATKPWQQVHYVVSSNQDALEDANSAGGGSLTDGIVDISKIIPGSQTTLRATIREANAATTAKSIYVGRGMYHLTLAGTGGDDQGDFDIAKNVTILGAGAGVSVVDAGSLVPPDRIFDIASAGVLNLHGVTLTLGDPPNGASHRDGGAIRVQNGGQLHLFQSAVVGNSTGNNGDGGGIYFGATASGTIDRSVIAVNVGDDETGGVYLAAHTSTTGAGAVTVAKSIIAKNTDNDGTSADVYAGTNRTFISGGNNRLTQGGYGFTHNQNGDHIGPVDYIVTSVADTYDGSSDPVNRSIRDAIHQANVTGGVQEIWLPAWKYVLTRDRITFGQGTTDTSVAFGDLDIGDSVTIRGVNGFTAVAWRVGAPQDATFELLGNYKLDDDGNGIPDQPAAVTAADFTLWELLEGTSDLSADGDDDGDVDQCDYDIWEANFGNTLTLLGV